MLVLSNVEDRNGNVTTWVVPPFASDTEYDFQEWWRTSKSAQEDRERKHNAGEQLPIRTKGQEWAELLAIAVQRVRRPDGSEIPVQLDAKALLKDYEGDILKFCGLKVLDAFFAPMQPDEEESLMATMPAASANSPLTTTSSTSAASASGTEDMSTPISEPPPTETI
jgi:hypothetical protein